MTTQPPQNSTAAAQLATKYYGPISVLPPTDNKWISALGGIALYNPTLFSASQAIFQHTLVLGIVFLLRGFSCKRLLDLHYLTIIFAITVLVAPFIFLIDREISKMKLLFFLEHEAIEAVIAVRVLAPRKIVSARPGLIILVLYAILWVLTLPTIFIRWAKHAAEAVAWGAFVTDFLTAISGIVLLRQWCRGKRLPSANTSLCKKKMQAEAVAGIGFMLHGFVTMCVPPIFALILHDNLDPNWFAYGWTAVWLAGYFAVGLAVPSACLFLANIWWCCGSRKPVFPGQADWLDQDEFMERDEEMQRLQERLQRLSKSKLDWLVGPESARSAECPAYVKHERSFTT